jgi:predicted molibdopterin-dependent oxidoreductase YjgC
MITLTVDGREVTVPAGSSVKDACEALGIEVPTLCWAENLDAATACRLCVVEVDGSRVLVPSCGRAAEAGMVVHTDSARVRTSRKLVLELLASSADLSASADITRWMAGLGAKGDRFGDCATQAQPILVDNDQYVRDYSRCILCYKCVDACGEQAQGSYAITAAGRGFHATIATEFEVTLPDSACVYCGNCVGVCPTAALQPKTEHDRRQAGTWAPERQTTTDTICPYCGVGCTLTLHAQDGEIVKVTSPADNSVTGGMLCIKGRFGTGFVKGGPRT